MMVESSRRQREPRAGIRTWPSWAMFLAVLSWVGVAYIRWTAIGLGFAAVGVAAGALAGRAPQRTLAVTALVMGVLAVIGAAGLLASGYGAVGLPAKATQ